MNEEKQQNVISGLDILQQATAKDGTPVLDDLAKQLKKIVRGMRRSPGKGGSLSVFFKLTPHTDDAELISIDADVRNVKIPAVDARPIFAFADINGALFDRDPKQPDLFDAKNIDEETGEIKSISTETNKVKLLGDNKK